MSDSDPADRVDDGVEDDLFGDEDVGEAEVASEDEAASDRDEDLEREERAEERRYTKEQVVMGMSIYRHRIPKPKDGNVSRPSIPWFAKPDVN